MRIRIRWENGQIEGQLEDKPTARLVWDALPCTSSANTWGDEVYFTLPVQAGLEPDAKQVVDPGAICFWTQGSALALPFGPTPISQDDECRLASECNLLGKLDGDPRLLSSVRDGDTITIERAE